MRALNRKLVRDVWHHRSQMATIAVVMMCGVALFVALRSMHGYLRERRAAYYARYHFADVFAQVRRAPLPVAERLRAIPGVAQVATRVTAAAVLDVPGLAEPANGWLVSLPVRTTSMINGVVLRSGRFPASDRADEVLVSQAFAGANHLRPGDTLGAILRGHRETLHVTGTAISPEFIYEIPAGGATLFPDNRRFGVIWMPEDGLAAAFDMRGAFNDAVLLLAPDASRSDVVTRVDRILARYGGLGAYERRDQTSEQFISSEIDETRITSILLPSIFLAVTAFLLHLVLSRLVATEREQVAVLKAFGYPGRTVAWHYLAFAFVPVGAGTVLGGVAGLWLADAFAGIYARFYQFPDVAFRPDFGVLALAVVVSGGAALAGAWTAVRNVQALPPAEAMKPESPSTFRPGVLDRTGVSEHVPLVARAIVRNLQRRPGRAILSATGLALALALTLTGRYLFDAIDYMRRLEFYQVRHHDLAVGFTEARPPTVRGPLAAMPGVYRVELARDVPVRLRHGAASERIAIRGLQPDAWLTRVIGSDGRAVPVPAAGLLLSSVLARRLHARPGDTLTVEILTGRRLTLALPVAAEVDQLLGLTAYMEFGSLHRALRESPTASVAYLAADPLARQQIDARLKALPAVHTASWLDAERTGFEQTIEESFQVSITTILLFAIIIASGVVYNAGRVSLAERGRELASLRVLGFSRREVAAMLLGEQAILLLVAIPVGLGLGRALCWLVSSRHVSDIFRLPLVISRMSHIFAVGVVLVAAIGSAFVIWRRLGRLDLVAVLKTRE